MSKEYKNTKKVSHDGSHHVSDIPEKERFCPNCLCYTMQAPAFIDPDDPDYGEAWCCSQCLELIDIVA